MTLVLATGGSGNFVAMSSDKRKIFKTYLYDIESGEYEDAGMPNKVASSDEEKVIRLTDYVLLGAGGSSDLGIFILEEMQKLVEHNYELTNCAVALQKLIDQIRYNKSELFMQFVDQEDGIMVIMIGFFQDGSTGMVTFRSGPDSEVEINRAEPGYKQYAIIPPVSKYLSAAGELFDTSDYEVTDHKSWVRVNTERMQWIHEVISEAHSTEVSVDGVMHLIELNSDGTVKYSKTAF